MVGSVSRGDMKRKLLVGIESSGDRAKLVERNASRSLRLVLGVFLEIVEHMVFETEEATLPAFDKVSLLGEIALLHPTALGARGGLSRGSDCPALDVVYGCSNRADPRVHESLVFCIHIECSLSSGCNLKTFNK